MPPALRSAPERARESLPCEQDAVEKSGFGYVPRDLGDDPVPHPFPSSLLIGLLPALSESNFRDPGNQRVVAQSAGTKYTVNARGVLSDGMSHLVAHHNDSF